MRSLVLHMPLRTLSVVALAGAFVLYLSTDFSVGGASPLALLLMGIGGWLLQWKETLTGNLLLLFAGGALVAFPFLFEAPACYSLLALPVFASAVSGLLHWWKKG